MPFHRDLEIASQVVTRLGNLKIANAMGNSGAPQERQAMMRHTSQVHLMQAINNVDSTSAPSERAKQVNSESTSTILALGQRTIASPSAGATCDQCAAAVVSLLVGSEAFESPIERVNDYDKGQGGQLHHAFVLCGRDPTGDVMHPDTWGEGAFVIDVWYANQGQGPAVQKLGKLDKRYKDGEDYKVVAYWPRRIRR